ncbi:MAG: hypothetical protein ACLFTT_06600 [Candidatus Hydrogenedentota bacterium]
MAFRAVLGAALLCAATAVSQHAFTPEKAGAVFRDAAIDATQHAVYFAVYDLAAVWAYDPAGRDRIARIPVGRGPAALAIAADGRYLACANRFDNTVSIVLLPEHTVHTTVGTGKSPGAIAAMPDGRFAVTATFGDTVTIIAPATGEQEELPFPPKVPTAIAAGEEGLAVAGQAVPEVRFYPYSGGEPVSIETDSAPRSLAALPGNRFALATEDMLQVVAGATGKVLHEQSLAVQDVACAAGRLLARTNSEVLWLAGDLDPVERLPLAVPAPVLAAGGGITVAIAPAARQWHIHNPAGHTYTARTAEDSGGAPPPPPILPSPARSAAGAPSKDDTLRIVDAEPAGTEPLADPALADSPAQEPPAEEDTREPQREAAPADGIPDTEPAAVPADSASKAQEAPAAPAPPAPPADAPRSVGPVIRVPETPLAPSSITQTREPAQQMPPPRLVEETRAPRLVRRPSAMPFQAPSAPSLVDALEAGGNFGPAESLFQTPDWTQPLRDLDADNMGGSLDSEVVEAEGNVRLRLGETRFRSDTFTFNRTTGEMHAQGNVVMEQGQSVLTADEVFYTLPAKTAVPTPYPLVSETAQEQAKRRLSLGTLEAVNVRIIEPDREIESALVDYDALSDTGEITGIKGWNDPFYFAAERIKMTGPGEFTGEEVWVTTCESDPAPYRIRITELRVEDGEPVYGKHARLQIRNVDTPIYVPLWSREEDAKYPWAADFDSGRQANLGMFMNVGQRFHFTPEISAGPRLYVTQDAGIGLGGDAVYDFMSKPASPLYRTEGEIHGLYTTEERGYIHWYNRYEPRQDLVVRMQAEQWEDEDFYKDFYYDRFQDRTEPRTFAHVTYSKPGYIAAGTMRLNTHNWMADTERLPEGTFRLLDREVIPRTYLSFDSATGYLDRQPQGDYGMRSVHVARLTYDLDLSEAIAVTPFYELDTTWYARKRADDSAAFRVGNTVGITGQTRFHKRYDGFLGFSGFKHVVVPSITYSYRPEPTLDADDTPIFDTFDTNFGRSRIESKLDNVIYGKDEASGQVWPVGRLTLYQGNDFWSEFSKTEDYEIELDLRPRPWWGLLIMGERHEVIGDTEVDNPQPDGNVDPDQLDGLFESPFTLDSARRLNAAFGDFNRLLAQLYYNDEMVDGRLQGRLGFSFTETRGTVFNREILYGLGYQVSEKWGLGFEQRYDFEDRSIRSQSYEVRRHWSCWDSALRVRDRESGTDIDLEISISAFPGSRVTL